MGSSATRSPPAGPDRVAVAVGPGAGVDANGLRDAAAAFANVTSGHGSVAFVLPDGLDAAVAA